MSERFEAALEAFCASSRMVRLRVPSAISTPEQMRAVFTQAFAAGWDERGGGLTLHERAFVARMLRELTAGMHGKASLDSIAKRCSLIANKLEQEPRRVGRGGEPEGNVP